MITVSNNSQNQQIDYWNKDNKKFPFNEIVFLFKYNKERNICEYNSKEMKLL